MMDGFLSCQMPVLCPAECLYTGAGRGASCKHGSCEKGLRYQRFSHRPEVYGGVQAQMQGRLPPMEDVEGAAEVMQQMLGQLQDMGEASCTCPSRLLPKPRARRQHFPPLPPCAGSSMHEPGIWAQPVDAQAISASHSLPGPCQLARAVSVTLFVPRRLCCAAVSPLLNWGLQTSHLRCCKSCKGASQATTG